MATTAVARVRVTGLVGVHVVGEDAPCHAIRTWAAENKASRSRGAHIAHEVIERDGMHAAGIYLHLAELREDGGDIGSGALLDPPERACDLPRSFSKGIISWSEHGAVSGAALLAVGRGVCGLAVCEAPSLHILVLAHDISDVSLLGEARACMCR